LAVPVHDRLPPAAVAALRCPLCADDLEVVGRALRCRAGHAYDVARQGHVDLRGPRGSHGAGDDAAMVARRLSILRAGHFDPLLEALAAAVRLPSPTEAPTRDAPLPPGLVVDVGSGPGVHLAHLLDELPDRHGLAVDVSGPAARRAAQAHRRAGAIVADVWHGLPLADDAAAVVLDVFAPRRADEFHRILARDGILIVVTPEPDHLASLTRELDLLTVDPDKDRRLADAFSATFDLLGRSALRWSFQLDRVSAADLAGMGPGGHHLSADELTLRAARLPALVEVEAAVAVSTYRPLPGPISGTDGEEGR
jgi:23S rRNA (guanine745-N1)-methyltransferase